MRAFNRYLKCILIQFAFAVFISGCGNIVMDAGYIKKSELNDNTSSMGLWSAPHFSVQHFAAMSLGSDGTVTNTIEVDESVVSILFVFTSDTAIYVRRIVDPDNNKIAWETPEASRVPAIYKGDNSLFDMMPELGLQLSLNPVVSDKDSHVATALVTNNPALSTKAGKYKFEIYGAKDSFLIPAPGHKVEGYAVIKRGRGASSYKLNLALHFAGNLSAEQAKTDATIQHAIAKFRQIYLNSGISLDRVSYESLAPHYNTIDCTDTGDFGPEKFSLMQEMEIKDAVNVAIIDSFDGKCASIGGVAGAVPGPLTGTKVSGVIVARNWQGGDPKSSRQEIFATNLVHEVGHFLGLFHTVDLLGIEDPIADTDSSDYDNPMYWMSSDKIKPFSKQQAEIIRLHPLVIPIGYY